MAKRLTLKRLYAMQNALSSMLAGMEGEGDWNPEISEADMEAAHEWVWDRITEKQSGLISNKIIPKETK